MTIGGLVKQRDLASELSSRVSDISTCRRRSVRCRRHGSALCKWSVRLTTSCPKAWRREEARERTYGVPVGTLRRDSTFYCGDDVHVPAEAFSSRRHFVTRLSTARL